MVGWTEWSECSVTCGKGIQYRSQTCVSGEETGAAMTTTPCVNAQVESRECSKTDCESRICLILSIFAQKWIKIFCVFVSEGNFSEWSEWSECSNDTDSYRFRIRECLRPEVIECRMGERIQYEICSSNVTSLSQLSSTLPPTTTSLAFDEILELSGKRFRIFSNQKTWYF